MSVSVEHLISEQDGLPVVDIMQPDYWQHTHEVLRAVRAKSRVYRATPFLIPAYARYQDVETLLRDDRLGSPLTSSLEVQGIVDGPLHDWWSHTILFNDEPVHTRLRSLVSKAFTPRRAEGMRPVTRAVCAELLDELVPRGEFDFLADFAHHVPIRVIAEMLGVPSEDYKTFAVWTAALSGAFNVVITPEVRKEVEDAIVSLRAYAEGLIETKKRAPADDLLTALIDAEEAGDRLDQEELIAMILALLFAGHDTTKSLLTIGIKTLIEHPEAYRALQDDPTLAESVVEEILRFESPVTGVIRKVREPFEHAGVALEEGRIVFCSLLSSHRDEERYPAPDRFDIHREDKRHLAFGLGRHFCVGNALGRLEAQEGLLAVAARLEAPRLRDAPEWVPFAAIRRFPSLPIQFTARNA